MQLTKHRDMFYMQLSPDELVFMVEHMGSNPQTDENQEKVSEWLKEMAGLAVQMYRNPEYNT